MHVYIDFYNNINVFTSSIVKPVHCDTRSRSKPFDNIFLAISSAFSCAPFFNNSSANPSSLPLFNKIISTIKVYQIVVTHNNYYYVNYIIFIYISPLIYSLYCSSQACLNILAQSSLDFLIIFSGVFSNIFCKSFFSIYTHSVFCSFVILCFWNIVFEKFKYDS